MECKQVSESIPVWMDSALPPEESAAVGQHLARCPQCRQEFKDHTNSWNTLRAWPDLEPQPGYLDRFWKKMREQESWQERTWKQWKPVFTDKAFIPGVIVVCLFFLIAGVTLYNSFSSARIETIISNLSANDIDFIENMGVAQDFEVVKDLEFLQDLETIEKVYNQRI